jgi:hypothetical protein
MNQLKPHTGSGLKPTIADRHSHLVDVQGVTLEDYWAAGKEDYI